MKLKTAAAVLLIAAFVSTATAQKNDLSVNTEVKHQVKDLNLTELEQKFNRNTERIPGFVGSLIGDQTIAVNLSGVETGSEFMEEDALGIKTQGKRISEIRWGAFDKTTLKIWIDESDIEQLSSSQRPLQEFKKMLKSGEIKYETYTFGNKIKMMLLSFFL
jgi:hypothetical protein